MKTNKVINIILLLVIIVGVIYFKWFYKPEPEHILDPNIQWKTDTLKVPTPYPVPKPYPVKVPPRIVKVFETDTSLIDSLKLLLSEDSILINGLESQISIHKNYLKQFPHNPKLIQLGLQFDTLSLVLLDVSGVVSEKSYPLFTEFYNYQWLDNNFTRKDNKRKPPQSKTYLNYKAGLGYDILYLTPYLQGEVSKGISNFEVYGRIGIGLLDNSSSEIKLGANYNFGKNGKR